MMSAMTSIAQMDSSRGQDGPERKVGIDQSVGQIENSLAQATGRGPQPEIFLKKVRKEPL